MDLTKMLGEFRNADEPYHIQAIHDVLVSEIPPERGFTNPRDGSVALIKLGAQGVGITGPEIAGAVARLGGIGTLTNTVMSNAKFHHRDSSLADGDRNLNQYMMALTRMYESLANAQGGLLAENTLVKTIDFKRNTDLLLRQSELFALRNMGVQFPTFDLVDLAAGAVQDYSNYIATCTQKGIQPIPASLFVSTLEQLIRSLEISKRRYKSLPFSITKENGEAAGHNGAQNTKASSIEELERYLSDSINKNSMPRLILAGGFQLGEDLASAIHLGASAIQIGSRFTISRESDASKYHKQLILNARYQSTIPTEWISPFSNGEKALIHVATKGKYGYIGPVLSTSGMYVTGVVNPFVLGLFAGHSVKKRPCEGPGHENRGCLTVCGYSPASIDRVNKLNVGEFCIEEALQMALKGDPKRGLYFAGVHAGKIPERESMPVWHILKNIYLEAFAYATEHLPLGQKVMEHFKELKSVGEAALTHRLFTHFDPAKDAYAPAVPSAPPKQVIPIYPAFV